MRKVSTFRFNREKILPLFLASGATVFDVAKSAGVSSNTVYRAVNGNRVSAPKAAAVARALNVDVMKYLVEET